MRKRLSYGLAFSLGIVLLLWTDHYFRTATCFSFLVLVMALFGWREYSAMALPDRLSWHIAGAAAIAGCGITVWILGRVGKAEAVTGIFYPAFVTGVLFLLLLWPAVTWNGKRPTFTEGALWVVGVLYLGILPSYILLVRFTPKGEALTILFLFAVKAGDSGAYFFGKALGRLRFFQVSPRKTVEGAAAGLATTCLTVLLGTRLVLGEEFCPPAVLLVAGVAIAVTAQAGDLIESLLKRSFGTKHSASVVPELGGVLDMIDSVVFSAPVLYYLLLAHGAA